MIEYLFYLIVGFLSYFIWVRYHKMRLRDKMGIRGPKANFLFGNMLDIMKSMKEHNELNKVFEVWRKKYGNVFGVYFGSQLFVVINDLEMAREILIKQFSNFVDRPPFPFIAHKPLSDMLTILHGEKWKQVRNTLTPMFTSSKLKQMSSAVDDKLNVFMSLMSENAESNKSFDIYNNLQCLTLDVIGKCAFAMDVKSQTDPNDKFLEKIRITFQQTSIQNSYWMMLCYFFPEFNSFISYFRPISKTGVAETWLFGNLKQVIESRKRILNDFKSVDVLQILLEQNAAVKNASRESKENQISFMDDSTIIANIYLFLLAGYETTSTALAFTIFLLAKYPEIQKRLQQEIDQSVHAKELINYETVRKLAYMEAVFRESLRMYPPVTTFISRDCSTNCTINGVTFAPGVQPMFMPRLIHQDPELWENPEDFDPERFLGKDVHPMAWLPFGIGPRNCIGMRFADMEAKMCLFRLLSEYNISLGANQKDKLEVKEIDFLLRPRIGVFIKLSKRESYKAGSFC